MENKFVKVQFYNVKGLYPKEYDYHTYFELGIGDLVIVETHNGFAVGRVSWLYDKLPLGITYEILEVVQKIDLCKFKNLQARSDRENELKGEMRNLLNTVIRQSTDDLHLFELIAKENPEMQRLVIEYKNL